MIANQVEVPDYGARWVATLTNGEIATEGSGQFAIVKGEDSPWQKLMKYVRENRLGITSMKIIHKGQIYHLPSVDPKFGGKVPKFYNHGRLMRMDVGKKSKQEVYIFIEAVYEDFVVRLYVDEVSGNRSWVSVE